MRAMQVASNTGWYPCRTLDPAQVSMSYEVRLSLAENRNLASPGSESGVMVWNMPYFALVSFREARTDAIVMRASAP